LDFLFPVHFGARFSMNALGPSLKSSVLASIGIDSADTSQATIFRVKLTRPLFKNTHILFRSLRGFPLQLDVLQIQPMGR